MEKTAYLRALPPFPGKTGRGPPKARCPSGRTGIFYSGRRDYSTVISSMIQQNWGADRPPLATSDSR